MGRFTSAVKFLVPSVIVAVTAPLVLPAIYRAARPVVLGLVKGGVLLADSMKEAGARVSETVADLSAEVAAEIKATHEQGSEKKADA